MLLWLFYATVEGQWELLFMIVLILSKYFMSCCPVVTFHIFNPYQISFNKGQYLTHMVSGVHSVKVAAISSTRWNPRKWFFAMCVCWVTTEWHIELLWKTHFSDAIRLWPPLLLVSRILQAVVSLSDFHDEYTSICYSVCFTLLIHPWINTFIIQRRLWSVHETSQASNELLQHNRLASDTCPCDEQTQ